MSKKTQKLSDDFEFETFEVSVCNNKELQSFLNVFHFKEENQSKEHLGELFGVIKVFDHSQQSAYLPNLLSQVLKKEFYSNSKRTAEEAFESALKKANIALSDLTRHEVVGWIGKLHAVLGVIQKDNFFFTQSGGGRILLLREKKLTDISRDLDVNDSDHPIKTFSDISTGKLLLNDKIIFATESFFETFSWEDLKRHSSAFNSNEFDNLIKSTLELEANDVGICVVNIKEKIISPIASLPRPKKKLDNNYFGDQRSSNQKKQKVQKKLQSDFDNHDPGKKTGDRYLKDKKGLSPFEKQPELYIKEDEEIVIEKKKPDSLFGMLKEAIDKTKTQQKKKQSKGISQEKKIEKQATANNTPEINKEENTHSASSEKMIKEDSIKVENMMAFSGMPVAKPKKQKFLKEPPADLNQKPIKEHQAKEKETDPRTKENLITLNQKSVPELSSELAKRKTQTDKNKDIDDFFGQKNKNEELESKSSKNIEISGNIDFKKTKNNSTKRIFPKKNHFEKIKGLVLSHLQQYSKEFNKLKESYQQSKLNFNEFLKSPYIFSTIIFAIILSLLLIMFFKKDSKQFLEDTQNQLQNNQEDQADQGLYNTDKEVAIKSIGKIDSDIVGLAGYKNDIYLITEDDKLYRYDNNVNELSALPSSDDIHDIVSVVEMPVLNLIFFVSNDSVYSYSPVLERFDKHKIEFPGDLNLIGAGVHRSFSFLYIFDRNSGQVYRYPRTEGGFGPPINWFQKPISAEKVVSFAIDDGIRVTYSDGTIEQYYQKKLKDTFIINTEQKVIPKKIFTNNEIDSYYILDSEYPRILKIDKNANRVTDQYWNKQFQDAKDFVIHVEKEVYVVSNTNELLQFSLQ